MQDYVITTNANGLISAFYIKDNNVHCTRQKDPNNKTAWTPDSILSAAAPAEGLGTLLRVEVCLDTDNKINVIVVNEKWEYFITWQTGDYDSYEEWTQWQLITQS